MGQDFEDRGPRYFSLTEVTSRVEEILRPAMGKLFWVRAEISSGRERGGSFYCDLVETGEGGKIAAKMSCTVWSRDLAAMRGKFRDAGLDLKLDDGTQVGLRCALQFSPRHGLSLKAVDADPAFALGELELRRREILLRLEKEGLFEANRRLPVALLPRRVGVVTSRGSAAFNDFCKTLSLSPYGFTILVADAVMQGAQAERSVLRALQALEALGPDLVVIVRGGGSRSDLASLDNEAVARRVAACPLPVWTGIGHEIDSCVLDFVANRSFKTPTAVAEAVVDRFVEVDRHIGEARTRFGSTWAYRLQIERERLERDRTGIRQGTRKLVDQAKAALTQRRSGLASQVGERVARERARIGGARGRIPSLTRAVLRERRTALEGAKGGFIAGCERCLSAAGRVVGDFRARLRPDRFAARLGRERSHLAVKAGALRAFDPRRSLRRGFALVYGEGGRLVRSFRDVARGERLRTRFADGVVESTVDGAQEERDGEGQG